MVLVFDFDGTIADSLPFYLELGLQYAAQHHLTPLTVDQARLVGLRGLISHYQISKIELTKILLWGIKEINHKIKDFPLFPEMASTLKSLSLSHSLGIVSSNSKTNITQFLQSHQLSPYFSFIDCSPDLFGKHLKLRKLLKKLKCIDYYIGDETRDIEAARKAGIKSVAVSWGFEHKDLLQTARPDFLINSPKGLLQLVSP